MTQLHFSTCRGGLCGEQGAPPLLAGGSSLLQPALEALQCCWLSLLGSCGAGRLLLGLLSRGLLRCLALLLLLLLFRLGLEWQGWLFCRPCMRLLVWCCWVPA